MSEWLKDEQKDQSSDIMGSSEVRESYVSKIISYLSVSTIGELVWVDRYLERNFQKNTDPSNENSNIFQEKLHQIEKLLSDNQSMISTIANIKEEKESVQKHIQDLEKNLSKLSSEKESIASTLESVKEEKESMASTIASISEEKDEISKEKDLLAEELQRIGKLYEEATGKQASQEDLKEVLKLYITLMEEVFSGRAHFKVLSIIHGEKEVWTREELVKSTGFAEIKLRSVLGELVRADMIEYDEEQAIIQLKRRISSL